MKWTQIGLIILALAYCSSLASANGQHDDEVVFPAWTYYVEIVEHAVMVLIAGLVLVKLLSYKKPKKAVKYGFIGFAIFLLAEVLTIMHHFLMYTFGIYTAIVHHGLLLVSMALIAYAFIKSLRKK